MARLAAYYQEDFHYPSLNQKQRKLDYVVFQEPQNNFYSNFIQDSDRLRELATSEPALAELTYNSKLKKKTSKQRPYSSRAHQIPHYEEFPDSSYSGHFQHDNEPLYSYYELPDAQYIPTQRDYPYDDQLRKRLSYAESVSNMTSDIILNSSSGVGMNTYNRHGHLTYPDNYYHHHQPADFYTDSRQNVHWTNSFSNAAFFSPPSPLDSGLSSQSVTSSPTLETELERCRGCSCPRMLYTEPRCLSRFDSGRSSPGMASTIYPISKKKAKEVAQPMKSTSDIHQPSAMRYGKLGILGERTENIPSYSTSPEDRNDNFEILQENSRKDSTINKNGSHRKKYSHSQKLNKTSTKPDRPYVIVVKSPTESNASEGTLSPRQNVSDKSQGSISPMSIPASNSPSVISSNYESDVEDNQKSKPNRATENDIRELEDMYKKCNLSDNDLFDRAERRDLPTAHQQKRIIQPNNPRLVRSNSDTLYEMMSPAFRNPYETRKRAPPSRRSGLPDIIADDMALRKLKKSTRKSRFNAVENSPAYMLYSTHLTPTVSAGKDILLLDSPDVELDDLSYRKHYFGKKSRILDPQPPFGIPLRPPPPSTMFNDYLHAVPSGAPQALCHPRGNPDVVRDDLAFRALRKDESERIYYDISQVYARKKKK